MTKFNFGFFTLVALCACFASSAHAATITNFNFDQIALINALGGTVTQIGGDDPGKALSDKNDFDGTPNSQSGVDVTLPGWTFLDVANYSNGSLEPGNFGFVTEGSPTDITYTTPGANGPDGTNGDGSLQLLSGATLEGSFGGVITAAGGIDNDIFIFTNSAGGGNVDIDFLLDGSVVANLMGLTLASASAGDGTGGALLNLMASLMFDTILLTGSGLEGTSVEIDAIAAFGQVAVVPIPAAVWLFGSGLIVLFGASRRFRSDA